MSYRVEYNGADLEVTTLDAALDAAKQAIADDQGPISGWTVEHDETINDWFVQGVRNGVGIGPTAVVSGPEPMDMAVAPVSPPGVVDGPIQQVVFTGPATADAFASAATWLSGRAAVVTVIDIGWHPTATGYQLRLYYVT